MRGTGKADAKDGRTDEESEEGGIGRMDGVTKGRQSVWPSQRWEGWSGG